MESLEEYDLARVLNFRSSLKFLSLVEEELAGFVARAQQEAVVTSGRRCLMCFPPLQPKYAHLLNATIARFDLAAIVQGWGDERRIIAESTSDRRGQTPAVRCGDFRPEGKDELEPRLADVAAPSELLPDPPAKPSASAEAAAAEATPHGREAPSGAFGDAAAAAAAGGPDEAFANPFFQDSAGGAADRRPKRARSPPRRSAGGMRGWSDDEDEASDPRPRHAVAAASGSGAGRSMRGRGFLPSSDQEAGEAPDTPALRCALRGDYEKYTIDPEDTWRPQRKPYVELQDGWEFSNAWSLRPEDGPERLPRDPGPLVGVACWRVDHAEAQAFQVAFASSSREARGWLEGRGGRGEEPCVLELRPCCAGRRWDFRFARASALQAAGWRPLPWAEPRRTSFWAATFPAEGGRRYLCAGVGAFPERRFFAARVAAEPQVVGFGARGALAAFHVRDIVVFGRGSLLGSPFAGRDHFVEAPAAGCREALSALEEAGLREAVLGAVPLAPAGDEGADANAGCLLVCRSPGRAAAVAGALGRGARALVSSQWTWPPEDLDDSAAGPEAAKRFADGAAELWRSLRAGTVRELALFGELLARQTRHCEGTRLARGAALRLILGGLSGPASAPQPPRAGA